MALIWRTYTLNTPAGDLVLNDSTQPDWFDITKITGLDGIPIRATMDVRPQTDGGDRFESLYGPRHILFEGRCIVTSADPILDCEGYMDALEALEDEMKTKLDSILNAVCDLNWSNKVLVDVTNDLEVKFGEGMLEHTYVFGLAAEDAAITVLT